LSLDLVSGCADDGPRADGRTARAYQAFIGREHMAGCDLGAKASSSCSTLAAGNI
jgi:hypothetical protein